VTTRAQALVLVLLLSACSHEVTMVVPPRPDARSDLPPTFTLRRDRSIIEVHVGAGFDVDEPELERWVTRAVDGITHYFGRYAPPNVYLDVRPTRGDDVGFGTAYGGRQPWVFVDVGAAVDVPALDSDWVLVHELIHLAFPHLSEEHRWAMEGMATWVEPFIRLRDGTISRPELWRRFVARMPYGRPGPGDRGLDHTPTWGRTYWGGALFWMMAEVDIRRRTHNARGLRDGFTAIVAAGGDKRSLWSMDKVLSLADATVGGSTLTDLWESWRADAIDVDLDALWRELGVVTNGDHVELDDSAPGAALRRAIEDQAN